MRSKTRCATLKVLLMMLMASIFPFNRSTGQGVGINSTGAAADASALLDVSSTTRGTLITRMTTAQRDAIASPAQGLWIYNTTTRCFEVYEYGLWQPMYCASCPTPSQPGAISGTTSLCVSATNNGLTYSVPAVTTGPPLTYTWSYSGTGFTCVSGCTTNSITANFSGAVTAGTLSCTPTSVCGTGPASTQAISVSATPTTANAGPNQTNVTVQATLAANTPSVGTGLWSIVSGTGGIIATPSSPTSTFTGSPNTIYVLRWTISNPPCTPSTSDVSITFNSTDCPVGTTSAAKGGYVFMFSGGKCYVAATTDQSSGAEWGCSGTSIAGALGTAIGTGKSNTDAIIAACSTSGIAARVCKNYNGGGFTDWFLPSKDEFTALRPYITPSQGFTWTSSEYSATIAWHWWYGTGYFNFDSMSNFSTKSTASNFVRCIRSY